MIATARTKTMKMHFFLFLQCSGEGMKVFKQMKMIINRLFMN